MSAIKIRSREFTKGVHILEGEVKLDNAGILQLIKNHTLHFHKLNLLLTNDVPLVHNLQCKNLARVFSLRLHHL